MKYHQRADAIFGSELKPTSRLVLLALSHHADRDLKCWPAVPTLADKTGLTVRTVRRALRDLEACSFVTSRHVSGLATMYRLDLDPGHCDRGSDDPGVTMSAPPDIGSAPPDIVTGHPGHCDPLTVQGTDQDRSMNGGRAREETGLETPYQHERGSRHGRQRHRAGQCGPPQQFGPAEPDRTLADFDTPEAWAAVEAFGERETGAARAK